MALLASHAASRHLAAGLLSSGPLWREVHGLCVFLSGKKSLQNFHVGCQRDRQASPSRIDECLLIIH